MANAERMCPECLTTEASFPLIPGCQSCKETLAQDEYAFWNTPLYWIEEAFGNGQRLHKGVYPEDVMRHVVQPWKAFFDTLFMS